MDAPTRRDVLASNLLFITLGLSLLYQVVGWLAQALVPHQNYFSPIHLTWATSAGLLVFVLLRGGLYYGVRRGLLAAKLLVAVGFAWSLYAATNLQAGCVAGICQSYFGVSTLLLLAQHLLTLAALGVMCWPRRQAATS